MQTRDAWRRGSATARQTNARKSLHNAGDGKGYTLVCMALWSMPEAVYHFRSRLCLASHLS